MEAYDFFFDLNFYFSSSKKKMNRCNYLKMFLKHCFGKRYGDFNIFMSMCGAAIGLCLFFGSMFWFITSIIFVIEGIKCSYKNKTICIIMWVTGVSFISFVVSVIILLIILGIILFFIKWYKVTKSLTDENYSELKEQEQENDVL
jgi:hypothetical protein